MVLLYCSPRLIEALDFSFGEHDGRLDVFGKPLFLRGFIRVALYLWHFGTYRMDSSSSVPSPSLVNPFHILSKFD
jgi:hypothetical protein